MSNKLESVKKKLIKRRQELTEALSVNRIRDTDDTVKDPADEAFSVTQEDIGISLYNNELEEYKRINQALKMIESGTYGVCAECGQPISEKRLSVYPNTTRCLPCQEAYEAGLL